MQEQEQTSEVKYSTLMGKQAALYAKAGVDIASGSPLLVMAHTAAQSAVEQTRENQAGTEQSALDRYYGKIAAWNGDMGGISSFLSGLANTGSRVAGIMGSSGNGTSTAPGSGTIGPVTNAFLFD